MSGSVELKVPTVEPAATFSFTVLLLRARAVGASFWPVMVTVTVAVSVLPKTSRAV